MVVGGFEMLLRHVIFLVPPWSKMVNFGPEFVSLWLEMVRNGVFMVFYGVFMVFRGVSDYFRWIFAKIEKMTKKTSAGTIILISM